MSWTYFCWILWCYLGAALETHAGYWATFFVQILDLIVHHGQSFIFYCLMHNR